jgi:hypothetical protein
VKAVKVVHVNLCEPVTVLPTDEGDIPLTLIAVWCLMRRHA